MVLSDFSSLMLVPPLPRPIASPPFLEHRSPLSSSNTREPCVDGVHCANHLCKTCIRSCALPLHAFTMPLTVPNSEPFVSNSRQPCVHKALQAMDSSSQGRCPHMPMFVAALVLPPAKEHNGAVLWRQEILMPEVPHSVVKYTADVSIASEQVFTASVPVRCSMQRSVTKPVIGWTFSLDHTRDVCHNRQVSKGNGVGHDNWITLPLERLSLPPIATGSTSVQRRKILTGKKNCPLILKPTLGGGGGKKPYLPERGAQRNYRRCGRGLPSNLIQPVVMLNMLNKNIRCKRQDITTFGSVRTCQCNGVRASQLRHVIVSLKPLPTVHCQEHQLARQLWSLMIVLIIVCGVKRALARMTVS